MHKHVLRLLLLFGALVLAAILLVYYDIYAILLAWFWSAEEVGLMVGKTFLFRLIQRPFWAIVTRVVIVMSFGYSFEGRMRSRVMNPFMRTYARALEWWKRMPVALRAIIAVFFALDCALLLWVHWQIVVFVPFAGSVVRKIDYWTGDRLFDRWTGHVRFRVRRFQRSNPLARTFLRWPRRVLAFVLRTLEKRREERIEKRGNSEDSS
jgi:hypothetical protein